MRKLILCSAAALSLAACTFNSKLNKACKIQAVLAATGGGKVTVCVMCDSLAPRAYKKLVRKYGTKEDSFNLNKTRYE